MSKLGFNISRWTRDIADYAIALQPSVIVGIVPDESDWALLADILANSPGTVHLWRPTLPHSNDNDNLNADPDKLADFVIEQYGLRPGLIHAVAGRNEAISSENLDVQLEWEHRFCDRVQEAGIPYVCLSSGVGKLEPSDFDNPRLRELVDKSAAVGCHPYLPPGQADLGSPDDLYYVDRPALLWPAGILAKTIASEFGLYYSPYVADRLGRAVFSSQKHADLLIRKHKHFEAQGYLADAAFTLAAQGKFKNDGAEPWELGELPPEQTDNLGLVALVAFQQSQPARRVQFVIPGATPSESHSGPEVLTGSWSDQPPSTWGIIEEKPMLPGIDVSNYQAQIDWGAVAASGQGFAICKVTEGAGYTDVWFERNWSELQRVGMVRGAYHFARPSQSGPEEEAAFFLQVLEGAGGLRRGDLIALDLEDPNATGDLLDWTLRWLREVRSRAGFRPLIYSRTNYLVPHGVANDSELCEHGLWLASYQDTLPEPAPGWPFVAIWQHSSSGQVPGVQGNCDENYFNGDSADQLRLYGFQGDVWPTSAAPEPTPEPPTSTVPQPTPAGVTLTVDEARAMLEAIQELRERVTYIEGFLVID